MKTKKTTPYTRTSEVSKKRSFKGRTILIFVFGFSCGVYLSFNFSATSDAAVLSWYPSLTEEITASEPTEITASEFTGKKYNEYVPGRIEKYVIDNLEQLGFVTENNPSGCAIWESPNATSPDVHADFISYGTELDAHTKAVANFTEIPDLLETIKKTNNHEVCSTARPHPDGINALFSSNHLSLSRSGYVEPLHTPMRSHHFCNSKEALMSLDYLVHDFEEMCRKLKPTSRRILIDMGASLSFHGNDDQPIVTLLKLYKKFGFNFDHIYGYEKSFTKPNDVFERFLPEEYFPSYHWINTGVDPTKGAKMNPLHSILKQFNEDDFIVVKLDVDTASVETPLARQLLEDEDGIYHKLVDQFYFEHHVHMKEIAMYWRRTMRGSLKDSFELFYGLREKGIPAHFWP